MFCLNCGTKLSDDEQFCPQCGTAVDSELRDPEEPDTLNEPEPSDSETQSSSETEAADETESAEENDNADEENAPRLYQEPIPAPAPAPAVNGAQPPVEPVPAPPVYQNPPQPQYQQPQYQQPQYQQQPMGQPQYWQAQNQPNTYPAPTAAMPVIPPFMKRKQYFKSEAPEKIKGKADSLSFYTGMGLGVILLLTVTFLLMLLDALYIQGSYYNRSGVIFDVDELDADTMMIVSIVGLSVSAVFALLCVLGASTKHFGFYIPLLLPSLCMTAGTIILFLDFTERNVLDFNLSTTSGFNSIMLLILSVITAFVLFVSVLSLILSIIVSNNYKMAQKEYIWKATNGNIR